jgi:two-component system chemotaxis sensor kinase CheA
MSQDPLRYFRIEARELVDQISAGVLELDQQPGPDLVARLLRFAHTLKGAARVVRQPEIADRAHAFEEVLVPHRSGGEPLPTEQMRELLRLNDEIEERVAALEPQVPPPPAPLRFPPGMTPGGAGSSTAPRTAGSRTGPGTTPERRGVTHRDTAGEEGSGTGKPADPKASARPGIGSGRPVEDRAGEGIGGPDAPEIVRGRAARSVPTGDGRGQTRRRATAPDGPRAGAVGGHDDDAAADNGPTATSRTAEETHTPNPSEGTPETGTASTVETGSRAGTGATAPGSDPARPIDGPDDTGRKERAHSQESGAHPQSVATAGEPAAAVAKGEEVTRSPSHTESAPAARGATADVDELLDAVGEAHARFAPLRTGGQSLDQLTRSAEALADQLRVGRTAAHTDAARVVAARLAAELGALGRRITDTVEQVERELDEVRGRAERLRLVSASSIFTGLHRAVRDAADAQGKRVRFEGRGGDLRLDPQVLALASNALLHVVRNAVAHGIEADEDRLAAGKPVEGKVVVAVERRGRYVAFRCTDDGRGFDLAAVRRTAEERGLLMPGGTPPDEQTLVELVLRGGISTSPTVTEVSGRGIGLDVARDVADQLGGEVSVRTEAGLGASIELVLPLALMSLHGLIVEAAGTVATVPLDAVRTCVRLLPEQAAAAAVTGKMAHDGEAIPFLPLARALYAGTTVPEGGGPTVAVIVGLDGEAVAVGVDRLAGTSTLVVRPLPDLAPAAPVIGGVSMDLDGNPRLVLDAQGLVAETLRLGSGGAAPAEPVPRLPILVVDDSLTTRMLERSILESAGYEVDLAASGEEGLDRARSRRYGLYLTDIDMPGIDGFTFVAETRADPELAGVPAILVSSRASAEDRQRGVAVGASAYVVKGEFNQEELLAHIRRLVPA